MDLQEKDAYIAEHLMKMEKDTLRFMVADLVAEFRRLSETLELAEENGGLIVAERNRLTTANADLQQRLDAAEEAVRVAQGEVVALQWTKGEPPFPYCDEWFIARTIHRERVVLRSLPKEFSYDYKTADDTYMKRENITAWMQFPDSQYKSFALTAANSRVEELIAEQEHNQHLYQALEAAKAESNAADEENAALHLKCIGYLGQIITANRKQEEAESALASANSRVAALTVEVERLGLLQESHVMEAKRIDEEWEKMSSRVERLRDALEGIRLEMDGGYGDTDYQSLWKACDRGVKALVDDAKEVKSVEP